MSLDNYGPARDAGLVDTIQKVGIPVVVIDYRQQQLETSVPSTLLLGRLFGKEQQAQEVADYHLQQVNSVYCRVEMLKEPVPNVFLFRVAILA